MIQQRKVENMRTLIKYPGSKWTYAQWIIGHFPAHAERFTCDQRVGLWCNIREKEIPNGLNHAAPYDENCPDCPLIEITDDEFNTILHNSITDGRDHL